jgi:zinc and cadmium transporter
MMSFNFDIAFLIPFAAGNFIYIGATDLVPEVNKHEDVKTNIINYVAFITGILLMLLIKLIPGF